MLRKTDYEVIDFGDSQPTSDDDYPDFVVPLAMQSLAGRWMAGGHLWKWCWGIGRREQSAGVRACLIHETFSAHQGVEDDDLNMICLGAS